MIMVKAVGARTIGWMYRAAITPGVLMALVMLLYVHMLVLPRESALGEIARLPLVILGGRGHGCGGFYKSVSLVPDGSGGWRADDGTGPQPPTSWIVVDMRASTGRSSAFAAPTHIVTNRWVRAYDQTGAAVTLTPSAVAAARAWFEEYYGWGHDLDEALAGRLFVSVTLSGAYVQNAVLAVQGAGVAWCVLARAFAKGRRRGEERRRAAGLCVGCAYPVLRLAAPCPECGREYRHGDGIEAAPARVMSWDEIGGGPCGAR